MSAHKEKIARETFSVSRNMVEDATTFAGSVNYSRKTPSKAGSIYGSAISDV
jgi:hypothetical protein